jgi:flagellar motor component MotA
MKLLFAIIGTALFLAAMLLGGNLWAFFNMPSFLIVTGGLICFSLAHHDYSSIKEAIGNALSGQPSPHVQKDISVLATLRKTTYGSGLAGTLIGLIQMLQSLDDPSNIGPAMAVALLTVLYSVLIVEFIIDPLSNRILSQANTDQKTTPLTPPAQSGHAALMVVSAVLCLFVLVFSLN